MAGPNFGEGVPGNTVAPSSGTIDISATESPFSSIEIKSSPGGADITVDDKFVGNTPSTLKLTAGDHKIKVEKAGFKSWEKTLNVSAGGTLSLNAILEAQ